MFSNETRYVRIVVVVFNLIIVLYYSLSTCIKHNRQIHALPLLAHRAQLELARQTVIDSTVDKLHRMHRTGLDSAFEWNWGPEEW